MVMTCNSMKLSNTVTGNKLTCSKTDRPRKSNKNILLRNVRPSMRKDRVRVGVEISGAENFLLTLFIFKLCACIILLIFFFFTMEHIFTCFKIQMVQ